MPFLCCIYVGIGGGYNERENVEYVDREDSDNEYDDVSLVTGYYRVAIYVCCFHA